MERVRAEQAPLLEVLSSANEVRRRSLCTVRSQRSLNSMAQTFSCPVCLDERPVGDMVVFDPCGHLYCKPVRISRRRSHAPATGEHLRYDTCGHTLNSTLVRLPLLALTPTQCVELYLRGKIIEGDCASIRCPFPKCATVLQYHEIKALIDSELFAKYVVVS